MDRDGIVWAGSNRLDCDSATDCEHLSEAHRDSSLYLQVLARQGGALSQAAGRAVLDKGPVWTFASICLCIK
jgi:hypothetical protein